MNRKVYEAIDNIPASDVVKTTAKAMVAAGINPTRFLVEAISAEETARAESSTPLQPMPRGYTKTQRILHQMLTENTGAHVLDSGSIYGRHWQRNRAIKDFRKTPVVEVGEDYVLISVFHYLDRYLERDHVSERVEREFYSWADEPENNCKSWLMLVLEYAEKLKEQGWEPCNAFNSYNWENYLSQDVQGVYILDPEGAPYIFIQIHNGCDVRGGYTKPRLFKVVEESDGDFFYNMSTIYAICGCPDTRIIEPNGIRWLFNDDIYAKNFTWNREQKAYICDACSQKLEFTIDLD